MRAASRLVAGSILVITAASWSVTNTPASEPATANGRPPTATRAVTRRLAGLICSTLPSSVASHSDPAAAASSPVGDRPSSMGGPGRLVRGSIRTTVTPVLAAHTAPSRLASAEGIRPTPEATRTRATCLPVAASTRSTVPSSMRLTVPASWLATHTAPAATASDAGPPPTGILAWAWRGRTGTGCGRGPTGGPIVAPASDSAYLDMRKLIDPGLAWAHRSTRRPLRTADGLTALPESLPGAVEPPHGGPPASARGTGPFRRPPARTAHATFTACRFGDDCVSSGLRSRGTLSTVSVLCISQPPDPGCPISWPPSPCGRLSRPPWPVVVPATTPCPRSEEHTSALQSRRDLVCRLL